MGKVVILFFMAVALSSVRADDGTTNIVRVGDIRLSALDGKRVSVSGYLREVFADEVETNRLVAILKSESESAYLSFRGGKDELARLRALISARIAVKGVVSPSDRGVRPFEGPSLEIRSPEDVEILEPPPADVFSAKLLEASQPTDPKHIDALLRRRLLGEVLAVWKDRFLLRDAGDASYSVHPGAYRPHSVGRLHVVELAAEAVPPRTGAFVEMVGFPATDLHGINFLSDGSAHAVFSIVRELAANAVRHGRASTVRLAGTIDEGVLRFSVSDDGAGFDPDSRSGVEEGHFGLQGVSERVRALDGSLSIESAPGRGTRISVMIANLKGT